MVHSFSFLKSVSALRTPLPLGFCAFALLAGCSTVGGLFSGDEKTPSASGAKSDKPPIDCPLIQIEPGHSYVRVGSEDTASGVRYQISIGDVARECSVADSQLVIKVGAEVRTIIGSMGSPGAYSAPLFIGVRRLADQKFLASKTYQVGGAVNSSGVATISSLVADPLSVPYVNERSADQYEIVMSLGATGAPREKRGRQR